jgi:hypothetical protein
MVWLKLAALALVIAALGLPLNDLFRYALLLLAALPIIVGDVSRRRRPWLAALAVVAISVLGQWLLAAPRIEEGHNIFVVDGRAGALERALPAAAFGPMAAEFDARYPPAQRCEPRATGCWRGFAVPARAYAFSADGIYDRPAASRRVTGIDFSDPIWLRLGVVNDLQHNWYAGTSDIKRTTRQSKWNLLRPWRVSMPFYVMYRFPTDFVGSSLCWRGMVLWEGDREDFQDLRHAETSCRSIEARDVGRRIYGVSIGTPLAMTLRPPIAVLLRQVLESGLSLIAVCAVVGLLVRWRPRQLVLPFGALGLSLLVVLLSDVTFIGGVRPYDGGDDGLYYEGAGRLIAQQLIAGNFAEALRAGEDVYYYTSPGMRYLRALERLVFGDTSYGHLSLMLALPAFALGLFRRFLPPGWAVAMLVIFIAVPIGGLFGSSYFNYVKWAARGFADPAAAAFLLAGLLFLVGRTDRGPDARFAPALAAGFLFFLAVFLRPNLAPFAAVALGGAGLATLWQPQIWRLAGLCLGFLPVLSMLLHNLVYGGAFVLFTTSVAEPGNLPTPPSVYLAALGELLRLDILGTHVRHMAWQIGNWLSGPSESVLTAPVNGLAVLVVLRVLFAGKSYDGWLRLIAAATLAEHAVALFYRPFGRYYYVTWFLTLLICAVWLRVEGLDLWRRWWPASMAWMARQPVTQKLAQGLDWCLRVTGTPPARA